MLNGAAEDAGERMRSVSVENGLIRVGAVPDALEKAMLYRLREHGLNVPTLITAT
jgi:hypothetical protein